MDRVEVIYLDTHVLVFLYAGEIDRLGAAARAAIETGNLIASPAAVLELELLHETGRLRPSAGKLIAGLGSQVGLRVCELSFHRVVTQAMNERWGRDPFDRLIVANAKANDASLVTKDERIRRHYSRAIW
jgi:PIN domain nuclease of toxin-antitoxin system